MEPLSASLKLMKLLQVVWLAEVMAEMQMFATFWFTCVRKAAVSRSADKCVALGEVCAELPLPVPAGHDLWRGWLVKTLLPEPDNSDFLRCGHLAIKMSDPEDISSLGNEWHPHRWKCVCSICVIGMIEVIVFRAVSCRQFQQLYQQGFQEQSSSWWERSFAQGHVEMTQYRPRWMFLSSATWLKRKHYKADQSESGQSLSHLALQLEDQSTPRSRVRTPLWKVRVVVMLCLGSNLPLQDLAVGPEHLSSFHAS